MSTRLQDKRLWLGGGTAVAVMIVLIGWFLVIDPELSAAATTRAETEAAQAQNVLMGAKNDTLKAQNDNVAALRTSLEELLAALPSDDGLPAFTRQLSEQAGPSVVLTSIVVGAVAPVAAEVAATGITPAIETTTEAGTTTGATPQTSTDLLQVTITVAATGLGSDLLTFLQRIQTGPRRVLVTGSQLTPSGDAEAGIDGQCSLSLTLTIFSAPMSPEAQAALTELLSGN